MNKLVKEKKVNLMDSNDREVTFFISKFPFCDGNRIMFSILPRILNEYEMHNKLPDTKDFILVLRYVDIVKNGERIRLNNESVIKKYLHDDTVLIFGLLIETHKYNMHPRIKEIISKIFKSVKLFAKGLTK